MEGKAGVHLDQVFQHSGPSSPSRKGHSSGGDRRGHHGSSSSSSTSNAGGGGGGDPKHYLAQYKSCEMRYTILYNEYQENVMEVEAIKKKKAKLRMGKTAMNNSCWR